MGSRTIVPVLLFVIAGVGCGCPVRTKTAPPPAKWVTDPAGDLKALQGRWRKAGGEYSQLAGRDAIRVERRNSWGREGDWIRFDGDLLLWPDADTETLPATEFIKYRRVAVDEGTTPKTLRVTHQYRRDGSESTSRVVYGYRLNGDTLTLAHAATMGWSEETKLPQAKLTELPPDLDPHKVAWLLVWTYVRSAE